jgi:eukaryotic-like serine/threonine-protein kinase
LGIVCTPQQGQYEKAAEITRQAVRLAPGSLVIYENLANYALALQRFDEARQIIHEAQARKLDDYLFHNALYALAFLGADSARWRNSNSGLRASPNMRTLDLRSHPTPRRMPVILAKARELTKRAVDSAIRADSKENGAIWQAIAAQREAAYGNPAEARQSAAEALKLAPASQGVESEAALAFAMAGDTARAESWPKTWGNASRWTRRCSRFGCLRFRRNWRWTERTRLPP